MDDSALIPMADWNRVRAEFPGFPGVEQFPRINSHDLINLWLQQRPPCAVPGPYDDFERHLRMHVIASHPLDIQVAFEVIAGFESQLEADPIELSGEFIDIGGDPDRGNTLYIDPENSPEFLAFGVSPSAQVILANQLLWQPACE